MQITESYRTPEEKMWARHEYGKNGSFWQTIFVFYAKELMMHFVLQDFAKPFFIWSWHFTLQKVTQQQIITDRSINTWTGGISRLLVLHPAPINGKYIAERLVDLDYEIWAH
jgi:hypothetical protein